MCWACSGRCEQCGEPSTLIITFATGQILTCDEHYSELDAEADRRILMAETAPMN